MSRIAKYISSQVKAYEGNPLIEALPPIMSEERAAELVSHFPPTPESERSLPSEIRLHCIDELRTVVRPMPIHLELESAISTLIRRGYVKRNPMESATWRHLYGLSAQSTAATNFTSSASSFSLVGLSGMGKSTALQAVLKLYPQVIEHQRYQGREFFQTQITWLKLECPYDGSLKNLCYAFFKAVDDAVGNGSNISREAGSTSVIPRLIQKMEQVASTYFIGALFIDELQNLRAAKTGGKENMLNFFLNLVNSIGIPVVFIGTNSMIDLFSWVLRNARRSSGLGLLDFKRPELDDEVWQMLLEDLWEYQWLRNPAPLTPALAECLFHHSQGITDILTKLLVLGQRYAIQSGIETLNEAVFEHVSKTKLILLQPALDYLRTGDAAKLAQFEDLMPTKDQLEEMMIFTPAKPSVSLSLLRSVAPARQSKPADGEKDVETPVRGPVARSPASVARLIAQSEDAEAELARQGWLAQDALEFSPAYCRH
jgi:hypothetical protein